MHPFKFLSILSVALLSSSMAFSARSGWGSSGGGLGVVCFGDAATAASIDNQIKGQEALTAAQKSKIQSVVTLDSWEAEDGTLDSAHGASQSALLERFQQRINWMAPMFGLRLSQLAPHIAANRWVGSKELNGREKELWENSNDAHPKRAIPSNCRLIQLADRYTDHRDKIGNFPKTIPNILVVFDPEIFSKMDSLNQAMLIVHEEIYLMAKGVGHADSDIIRQFVIHFFSKGFYQPNIQLEDQRALQGSLVDAFGDYFLYFSDEPMPVARKDAAAYTQESRFYSFYSALLRIRGDYGDCQKRNHLDTLSPMDLRRNSALHECLDEAYAPAHQLKVLNAEEIFVIFGRIFIDSVGARRLDPVNVGDLLSSELLVVPFKDADYQAAADRSLRLSCGIIASISRDASGVVNLEYFSKMNDYCSKVASGRSKSK